jgi:SWI/SNF-related matrix-associated actin-dependent regulator of chromatin subfamily A3
MWKNSLNLATANRVFLVEPQWNPSVENQAIARALRLGQEQAVLVTRYVVDQSVELVCLLIHASVLVC